MRKQIASHAIADDIAARDRTRPLTHPHASAALSLTFRPGWGQFWHLQSAGAHWQSCFAWQLLGEYTRSTIEKRSMMREACDSG